MANTSSAKKAIRSQAKKSAKNLRHKQAFRDARKEVLKNAGSKELNTFVAKFQKEVDKAAKVGAISKNAASRYKSRLQTKLNSAA